VRDSLKKDHRLLKGDIHQPNKKRPFTLLETEPQGLREKYKREGV